MTGDDHVRDDLEARVRAALAARASEVDTSTSAVRRVLPDRGRARRWARVVPLAAAGVVLAVGAGVVVPRLLVDPGPPAAGPSVDTSAWRTEQWHGLAVDVPGSWGYGGAPADQGTGTPVACAAAESLDAQGRDLRGAPGGYVGRPIPLTDVCGSYPEGLGLTATPYVWLGAAVEPGVIDLGDGFVQETREVAGSTVTVGSRDAALREGILASAQEGETCAPELDPGRDLPVPDGPILGGPIGLRVCAYAQDLPGRGPARLTYATVLGPEAVDVLEASRGVDVVEPTCNSALQLLEGEWVVLELVDPSGRPVRRDVVHLVCRRAYLDLEATSLELPQSGRVQLLHGAGWSTGAAGGVRAVLRFFVGPLG